MCSANLSKHSNRYVQMMEYRPTEVQKELLIQFVKTYVFSSRYEEAQDETKIEELHKKRNYLASYCKLVVYNILPTQAACEIFKFYVKVSLLMTILMLKLTRDSVNSITTITETSLKRRSQRRAKLTRPTAQ